MLVLISCCKLSSPISSRASMPGGVEVDLDGSGACAMYRSDLSRHLRVLEGGSFVSFLVLCASFRAAQRLQRTLNSVFDLYDSPS